MRIHITLMKQSTHHIDEAMYSDSGAGAQLILKTAVPASS